ARDERLVAVRPVVGRAGVDEFDREERQQHHDQDRKCGALEETAHKKILRGLAPTHVRATRPQAYHGDVHIPAAGGASGRPSGPASALSSAATYGRLRWRSR